jgi:ATP-dependent Lon protease
MKESAVAALSYIRANAKRYNIDEEIFSKIDIHIHVPAGAIPKDGPSAGITMATALVSLLTNRPVRCDVAMTGEITLIGRVLPIGGVREKSLAAVQAGIKQVILPKENESSVEEISDEVRGRLKYIYVDNIDQVLKEVLIPLHSSKQVEKEAGGSGKK